MNRAVRVWLVLSVAYAIGRVAVDIGVNGILSGPPAGWLAIPFIATIQAALLIAVTRRSKTADEDGS